MIAGFIPDADVLDLFAGTGSLGIEALSRGAKSAVFIDKSPECCKLIKDNLAHTKLSDRAEVFVGEIPGALEKLAERSIQFDIIFLDPPYGKNFIEEALKIIEKNDIINFKGIVAAERDVNDRVPDGVGKLKLIRNQRYGDTVLSFYAVDGKSAYQREDKV